MATSDVIHLKKVRLSFPRLFKPKAFRPGQDPRFEATFLLDPSNKEHAALVKKLKETAKAIALETFNGKLPKDLKVCIGDGNKKDYDGYEGMIYLSTSNKTRPTVVDRNRAPLAESDGKPYAGCIVNASVTLWGMNNEFGKRINANLRGIQFVEDGEAFGMKPVDADEEFEMLEDGEIGSEVGSSDDFDSFLD